MNKSQQDEYELHEDVLNAQYLRLLPLSLFCIVVLILAAKFIL